MTGMQQLYSQTHNICTLPIPQFVKLAHLAKDKAT